MQTRPRDNIRRVLRLPPSKVLLLTEAAVWLCIARAALRFLPFPRVAAYVGTLQPASNTPQPAASAHQLALIRRVAQAVNATAIHSPVEMVCLPRALAAWRMLSRRGIASRLHFGKPLSADGKADRQTHAWLSSAGVEVTGYPVAHGCVEIGYFASPLKQHRPDKLNA